MVIVAHLEGFKKKAGLSNFSDHPIINSLGPQGVAIFFVLSGFLITYLLLNEKERHKKISLKKFYVRRILRIWPLYFLVLILGFFILPHFHLADYLDSPDENFIVKLFLCVGIMPNIVYSFYGHILMIGPLWSVGAEEQFYLIWPNIINSIKKKITLKPILLSYLAITLVKVACNLAVHFSNIINLPPTLFKISKTLTYVLKYDIMIVGGFFAYLFFTNSNWLKRIYQKQIQIGSILVVLLTWYFQPTLLGLEDTVLGILYGVIIINLATNKDSIINLENKLFNKGGQISYGIYMFHSLFVALGIKLFTPYLNGLGGNIMLYIFAFLMTFAIAYCSFQYLEKPILKFKEKFMVVKSGMEK